MDRHRAEVRAFLREPAGEWFLELLHQTFPAESWKTVQTLEELRRVQGRTEVIDWIGAFLATLPDR